MPSTISFSQGDVVLVPFPFTDLTAIKQRPALVPSPERLNKVRADLVEAAITSRIPDALSDDELLLSDADLRTSGLPKRSIVKLGKIFTISPRPDSKEARPRPAIDARKHFAETAAIAAMMEGQESLFFCG